MFVRPFYSTPMETDLRMGAKQCSGLRTALAQSTRGAQKACVAIQMMLFNACVLKTGPFIDWRTLET